MLNKIKILAARGTAGPWSSLTTKRCLRKVVGMIGSLLFKLELLAMPHWLWDTQSLWALDLEAWVGIPALPLFAENPQMTWLLLWAWCPVCKKMWQPLLGRIVSSDKILYVSTIHTLGSVHRTGYTGMSHMALPSSKWVFWQSGALGCMLSYYIPKWQNTALSLLKKDSCSSQNTQHGRLNNRYKAHSDLCNLSAKRMLTFLVHC